MFFGYHTLTWANFKPGCGISRIMDEIASTGFKGIEFGDPLSRLGPAGVLRDELAARNLKLVSLSCGLNMDPRNSDDIKETKDRIKYAAQFGAKNVMVCAGWLSQAKKKNGAYDILGRKLEECAEYASDFGIEVAYHPHKHSIVETGEDIDRLISRTRRTRLCIDIAHLTACGTDPPEAIRKYKDVTAYYHLKDWDAGKGEFVELGRGGVAVTKAVEEMRKAGYNGWAVIELDKTEMTPLESAKISYEFLRKERLL